MSLSDLVDGFHQVAPPGEWADNAPRRGLISCKLRGSPQGTGSAEGAHGNAVQRSDTGDCIGHFHRRFPVFLGFVVGEALPSPGRCRVR